MKAFQLQLLKKRRRNRRKLRSVSVSLEQLSIVSIGERPAHLEDELRQIAEYVLQKNADLYRRLS